MARHYQLYFNIIYQCNSRCIFCASDYTQYSRQGLVSFEQFAQILDRFPKGRRTVVAINGGETTVHPELIKILRLLKDRGHPSVLFSNGRRFSSLQFTKTVFDNFKGVILIPLYGIKAKTHDYFTRIKESFLETWRGIENIYNLKAKLKTIHLQIKLLFIKPLLVENCRIAKLILSRLPEIDALSLHSFIVSRKASKHRGFQPSRKELGRSINKLLDFLGSISDKLELNKVDISDLPLCIFSARNKKIFLKRYEQTSKHYEYYYFDPYCLSGRHFGLLEDHVCSYCEGCRSKNNCRYLKTYKRQHERKMA